MEEELKLAMEKIEKDYIEMTKEAIKTFGREIEEYFPYLAKKIITIKGKTYILITEINIKRN